MAETARSAPWWAVWRTRGDASSKDAVHDDAFHTPAHKPITTLHELEDAVDDATKPKAHSVRLPFSTLLVCSAYGLGFASGMLGGARRTALVYLAENAHRRPTTVQGWYFYNKTKYYRMILGGVRHGAHTGIKLAGWVAGYCLLDFMAENGRSQLHERFALTNTPNAVLDAYYMGHWVDGAFAGMATGCIGAVAYQLPAPIVPRILLLGAGAGGLTGGLRDVRVAMMNEMQRQSVHIE